MLRSLAVPCMPCYGIVFTSVRSGIAITGIRESTKESYRGIFGTRSRLS